MPSPDSFLRKAIACRGGGYQPAIFAVFRQVENLPYNLPQQKLSPPRSAGPQGSGSYDEAEGFVRRRAEWRIRYGLVDQSNLWEAMDLPHAIIPHGMALGLKQPVNQGL